MQETEEKKNVYTVKEKKDNWKFFAGIAAGMALMALAWFLYKGYYTVDIPWVGRITVELPTYRLFHSADAGRINKDELGRKIDEIEHYLDTEYIYDIDPAALADGACEGIINSLYNDDPYSEYYSVEQYKKQMSSWNGTYTGIGVYVRLDTEGRGVYIVNTIKGGPAEEAGLLAGDIITEADGTDLRGLNLEEATSVHIKGEEGTKVRLTVLRDGGELEFDVERRELNNLTVVSSVISRDGEDYGYIYVSQFVKSTYESFTEAVDELTGKNVKGLIVDLRNNPGGDMNVCLNMADYLLLDNIGTYTMEESLGTRAGRTLLLSIMVKNQETPRYYAVDGHHVDVPVVTIVNGESASAAEIFTGVMKSYGGRSCGLTTFGKGIVQTVRMLYDMSGIKYTSGEYVLPDSSRINKTGITPDVVVEESELLMEKGIDPEEPDAETDNQLMEALTMLGDM